MSTITGHFRPRLRTVHAYRVTVLLLSIALAAATALAVYFAVLQATAVPAQVAPPISAPGLLLNDPECVHPRVMC